MQQPRKYPSKILLTGEYTVLLGYPAIAIPWIRRYAEWKENGSAVDDTLLKFYHFIKKHSELNDHFLLDDFFNFIQSGGYLESHIPFGYGLGSSGSFCAAVLDRFSIVDKKDVGLVHTLLKRMEDFFHGQSSGLDPMISYFDRAVQICNGEISFPDMQCKDLLFKYGLCLVDSKLKRDTQQLVVRFKESIKDENYIAKLKAEIVPLNEFLILSLLNEKATSFERNWTQISKASLDVFQNMIPGSFQKFWEEGIQSKAYYCKLCGAGGGGLFLVKVLDEKVFQEQIKKYEFDKFH